MIVSFLSLTILVAAGPAHYLSEIIFAPEPFHNHSSSIVETPSGDLIACWFHGKGERKDDTTVILGARKRAGTSAWSEPFLMADTQDLPDQNPTLFIDPADRLWLFWTSSIDNEVRSFFLKYRHSTDYEADGPPKWDWQDGLLCRPAKAETAFVNLLDSRIARINAAADLDKDWRDLFLKHAEERRHMYSDKLFQRIGWLPRQPPIMLSDKRMMLGIYSDTFDCSLFAFTEDAGQTWEFSQPVEPFGIQPAIVQKDNGHLRAYLRHSPKTVCIESRDGGMTWTEVPLDIPNSGSSVAVLRLQNGNWILAVNDMPDARHQLSLYCSQNEGATWTRKQYLEKLDPATGHGTASYPTLIQGADRMIHVTYTFANETAFKGKTIKHAWFNEAWVASGTAQDAR
jgi:predicted neuraminidase